MKTRIIAVLLGMSVLLTAGIVYWSSTRSIQVDPRVLTASGVTQGQTVETVQFAKGDTLFRSWDHSYQIAGRSQGGVSLATSALLHFDNGDRMSTAASVDITSQGEGKKLPGPVLFASQSDGGYRAGVVSIASTDIVRLGERRYFYPAPAEIVVDGIDMGATKNTQVIIDRTGSVTLIDDNNQRLRFLGHLLLQADPQHIFDVSAEQYRVGSTVIDLTKFGGSDNQMSVLAGDADPGGSSTPAATPTQAAAGASGDSDSGSAHDPGQNPAGTGSRENGSTSPDLSGQKDIQKLLDQINQYNSGRQTTIPVVTLSGITVHSTSVMMHVSLLDSSSSLLGPVKIDVVDSKSSTVGTQTIVPGDQDLGFTGLTPGDSYSVRYQYLYQLGDDSPRQISAVGYAFTTNTLTARYILQNQSASALTIGVSTDDPVSGVSSASLLLTKPGNFFTPDQTVTRQLDPVALGAGSTTTIFTGLDPGSTYTAQLVLTMNGGKKLTLAASPEFHTLAQTELVSADAQVTAYGELMVAFDWRSDEYTPTLVGVRVSRPGIFGLPLKSQTISANDGVVTAVPIFNQETDTSQETKIKVELSIEVIDKVSGEHKTLLYPVSSSLVYKNAAALTTSKDGNRLTLSIPSNKTDGVTVDFQRSPKNTSTQTWSSLAVRPLTVQNDKSSATCDLDPPLAQQFDYRAVLLHNGIPTTTIYRAN